MCTLAHQLRINLTVYAFSRHVGGCVCVQLDNQNVSKKEREDAMRRFESNLAGVTFLDPLFRRLPAPGPFRYQCEA